MPGKGKPFVKGDPRAGRPKGRKNFKTVDPTLLSRAAVWLDSKGYFDNMTRRVERGRAPHAESYLLQRLHGRPTETVELTGAHRKPLKVIIEVVRD